MVGQEFSVTMTQLIKKANEQNSRPIKLHLQKQTLGKIWLGIVVCLPLLETSASQTPMCIGILWGYCENTYSDYMG